jgi:hypothetical protein
MMNLLPFYMVTLILFVEDTDSETSHYVGYYLPGRAVANGVEEL